MATKQYKQAVRDVLALLNQRYYGHEEGQKNFRMVMKKANKMQTADYAFWNIFKSLKNDIGVLADLPEDEILSKLTKEEEIIKVD